MTQEIRELKEKLKTVSGIEKVSLLNRLASAFLNSDPKKSKEYGEEALTKAKELGSVSEISSSYREIGISYAVRGEYDVALDYFQKALDMLRENGMDENLEIASIYIIFGNVYLRKADYNKALEFYFKAIRTTESAGGEDTKIASCFNNIGVIYNRLDQIDKALTYFQKSLEFSDENRFVAQCHNNIGIICRRQGKLDEALEYYFRALRIREEIKDKRGIAGSYVNIGGVYIDQKNYDKAFDWTIKSLNIFEEIDDKSSIATCCIKVGKVQIERQNYASALSYLQKGLHIARKIGDISDEMGTYKVLSDLYEAQNDFEKALHYFKEFTRMGNEIFDTEKSKQIAEMQTKYESEKKEKEAEIYRLKNVDLKELNHQLEDKNRQIIEAQEQIIRLEKENLERQMAGGFAHEIRNALAGSAMVLSSAMKGDKTVCETNAEELRLAFNLMEPHISTDELYEEIIDHFEIIEENEEMVDQILKIVNEANQRAMRVTTQILEYSKLGKTTPGKDDINLAELIRKIVEERQLEFTGQNIAFRLNLSANSHTKGSEVHFHSIINNIIINARDAILEAGNDRNFYIDIYLNQDELKYIIKINDNGCGIIEENLEKIFEPFFSTKPTTGTGLGLNFISKLVMLYRGKIDVKSTVGEGTTFTLIFPVGR